MTFDELMAQVLDLLQREGRVSYRALKRRFDLDDDDLEDLKDEIIAAKQLASDEQGRVLVWTGGSTAPQATARLPQTETAPDTSPAQVAQTAPSVATLHVPEAERRQLTVLFCDLVDSTRLARQFDPEDWRDIVRAYQQACAEVIQRFDGYIAQYLGDGLLVYFGYPQAHEDDAQRASLTGLGILDAMGPLNARLEQERGIRLAVRVGVHTGPVVVGAMGGGGRQEQLALGDTPNIAARLQGLAAPNTVVVSTATLGLIEGFFTYQTLGEPPLKGVDEPLRVYQLLAESGAQTRLDVVTPRGLTSLVGREQEVGLLLERWAQSTEGRGQVVLLSGEAGIGKSRLVEVLRERVGREGTTWLTFRCSPYHMNSALYPVITHLQRVLQLRPEETPAEQLERLERALQATRLPLAEAVPLLAALLSVPLAERYPSLDWSPQKQKQKTQEALVAWLLAEAERQPVLAVWEDLHWADPSTLEWLGLVLDQTPTAPLCTLLTYRPEFPPPWAPRSYLTQLTLSRLTRPQVEEMIQRITGGKRLPAEVVRQMVAKTDGVPLFVEELTKTVLEAGWLQEQEDHYTLTGPLPALAIPATLQDALRARLDRLTDGKAVAQLGAVLGRTFSYELLRAVSPLDELVLWRGLVQLVQAEVLYQRGMPPQATYMFKHALLQEAAYQSLLRSTRQHYHQRIAQVLEVRFPELCETQPELLAHHYTEAGLHAPAISYWQRAGQRAVERSANLEAISHLTRGLEALTTLSDTPERAQQELTLQLALGSPLFMTRGRTASEVENAYLRAYELCQQVGDDLQRFSALAGLWRFYAAQARLRTAHERAEQCFVLAQRTNDPALLQAAHQALGSTLFFLGELPAARQHLAQGIALYAPQSSHSMAFSSGTDPGVACLARQSWTLWLLGYPDRALARSREALALARETMHAYSLSLALSHAAVLHAWRAEVQTVLEYADVLIEFASEQGFVRWLGNGMCARGWALVEQGTTPEGIEQLRQGLANRGQNVGQTHFLAMLVEGYWKTGQADPGLHWLAEALATVQRSAEHYYEAELYRLQGELRRQAVPNEQEAENCFRQALDVARRQQARSLELRAAISLSRLWQRQGKDTEARALLAPIYGWFTEGFDTPDLQETKALLETLS
jgi:class 3 adenylate cyclase/tetratricopeptide (TPR) repeat protein